MSDALHAWQSSDWQRLIALAPPDELPVYDYRAWLEQESVDAHPDFTIGMTTQESAWAMDKIVGIHI